MKIIIVGAGQVGGTLAENLVGENNEISVVDTQSEKLRELQDKMDLQVVNGQGCHPEVLRSAGGEDADMVIAVTSDDATNMITCQICSSLFNTPKKNCPYSLKSNIKVFRAIVSQKTYSY
jgi:trk system potassium uptake protein TrkA